MQRYGVLFVAVALMLGADEAKKGSSAEELKSLQGVWTAVSFEANGEKVPEEDAKKIKLTVKENKWVLERGDGTNQGTIKLDASKNPKQFDAALEDSSDSVLGIYEVKDGTLKMCWSNPGGDRPTTFKNEEGKTVATYKKAKSD
jgi:uncharacterized protein (TIGR03067 family)